jgi:hypothetical protein
MRLPCPDTVKDSQTNIFLLTCKGTYLVKMILWFYAI